MPGVGYHDQDDGNVFLLNYIRKNIPDCEVSYYNWPHAGMNELGVPFKEDYLHKISRGILQEIILDFQYTIRHAYDMMLPVADIYIGHSAGSIIALTRQQPCIIFGSPAAIVSAIGPNDMSIIMNKMMFNRNTCNAESRKVFNIVNQYDLLALPLNYPTVENYYYKNCLFNPIAAHTDYWNNKDVAKVICDKIKQWTC